MMTSPQKKYPAHGFKNHFERAYDCAVVRYAMTRVAMVGLVHPKDKTILQGWHITKDTSEHKRTEKWFESVMRLQCNVPQQV